MDMMQKKKFALLRIAFGCVWLIDAYFKWQPAFFSNITEYLIDGAEGQPPLVQAWINLWIHGVSVNPHFFAFAVAIGETGIAIGLLLGVFSRLAMYGGIAMALVIWSTAEGFGGPYVAGSTDIGSAVVYVFVFAALLLSRSWEDISVGARLKEKRGSKE